MPNLAQTTVHNNDTASWIVFAVVIAGGIAYLTYQTADYVRIRRRVRAEHGEVPPDIERRRRNRIQAFKASLPALCLIAVVLILDGAMYWSSYPADSRVWLGPLDLLLLVPAWSIQRRMRLSPPKGDNFQAKANPNQ